MNKLVRESISFQRGQDPKRVLGIGEYFNRISSDEANGTSLMNFVTTNYNTLVKLFGIPDKGDEYKITTEWTIKDKKNGIYTIYDYKATNLYGSGLLSVKKFRSLPSYEWHIGGMNSSGIPDLIKFIQENEI